MLASLFYQLKTRQGPPVPTTGNTPEKQLLEDTRAMRTVLEFLAETNIANSQGMEREATRTQRDNL